MPSFPIHTTDKLIDRVDEHTGPKAADARVEIEGRWVRNKQRWSEQTLGIEVPVNQLQHPDIGIIWRELIN